MNKINTKLALMLTECEKVYKGKKANLKVIRDFIENPYLKNKDCVLGQFIPASIRRETYLIAVGYYHLLTKLSKEESDKITNMSGEGICITLPVLLWGLRYFCDDSPQNDTWVYIGTVYSFREISITRVRSKLKEADDRIKRFTIRKKHIIECIKQIDNTL